MNPAPSLAANPVVSPPRRSHEVVWKGQKVLAADGEVVVRFKANVGDIERAGILGKYGLTGKSRLRSLDTHVLDTGWKSPVDIAEKLSKNPKVEWAEPNLVSLPMLYASPDDPYYQGTSLPQEYQVVITQADRAWNDPDLAGSIGGTTVFIAVVDSGVMYDHEDFNIGATDTRILTSSTGPGPFLVNGNIVGTDIDAGDGDPRDEFGHGTKVASILGATAGNALGLAGVTWNPKVMPVKIFTLGGGFSSDEAAGIAWSCDNGAHVVNVSMGGVYSMVRQAALDKCAEAGVVVVAASGNSAAPVAHGASAPSVIGVGATDALDQWAVFSNFGPELDVVAPGSGVPVAQFSAPWYTSATGTSVACPIVSGLAALLLTQNPDWAPETVYRRITGTAEKVSPPAGFFYDANGHEDHMGYGRVNVYFALGGIDSTADYLATVYLRDSRTVLSPAWGTNPVYRHRFADHVGGTVSFSLDCDDRDVVMVSSAKVEITDPLGAKTSVALIGAVLTSRLAHYTASKTVDNFSFLEKTFIPEAQLTDSGGDVSRTTLPAYVLPSATPVTLEVSFDQNPAPESSVVTATVVAKDEFGNLLSDVPISASLMTAPAVGATINAFWGVTAGSPPEFKTRLTLAPHFQQHLLVFSVSATGLGGVMITGTVTGLGIPGLAVHKTQSPAGPVCAGIRIDYTVSWSNWGHGTVWGLTIVDTLPNGTVYAVPGFDYFAQVDLQGLPSLSVSAYSGSISGPWTPGEPPDLSGSPLIMRWKIDRIAPGNSGFIRYAVNVSTTLPGTAVTSGRASATHLDDSIPLLSEDLAVFVNSVPFISVVKSVSPATPFPSGPVTYTILVSNTSLATITTIKIVDTLSTHVSYVSQTFQSDDPKAKVNFTVGPPLAWTGTITLGPWDSATVTISGRRDACYSGLVSNTAWVWGSGGTCSATATTAVDSGFFMPVLSLSVIKEVIPAAPVNGGSVKYRIILSNTGQATITSVRITDTLPGDFVYASQASPAPLVFAQTGNLVIWTGAASIKPGAALTVTITGTASLCGIGAVSNTAWAGVSDGCRFVEDIGSTAFVLSTPVLPAITMTKTLVTASPINNGPAKFRITIRNISSATITNVLITDTLPASLNYTVEEHPIGLVFASVGGGLVSWGGPYSLTPGRSLSVTVTGTVGMCFNGNVSNTAWAMATATCASVEGSAVTGFDLVRPAPDLVISKTLLPATPANGDGVKYRITVSNIGTATVTSILITDTLPMGFNYESEKHPSFLTFNNTAGVLSWSATTTMGFGINYTVTVSGQAALCLVGTVSNTAWVLGRYVCGEQQKTVEESFVLSTPVLPVIAVTKSFTPSSPRFNMPVTFRVSMVNNSVSTLTNILVVDTLPSSVGFVSEQHPAGVAFSNSAGILSWSGAVSIGPWRSFTVTVTGVNLCYTGEVTNTAWVMAVNPCSSVEAISTTSYSISTPLPVLTVSKTVTPAAPKNGEVVRYRIVVTNTSAATVTNLHISDTLPGEIGYSTEAHPAALKFTQVGTILSWTGTGTTLLGPGRSLTVSITGVASWCHLGPVSNTAWAYGGNACGTDEAISNLGFTLSTPVVPAITVRNLFSPAKPLNDGPVSYRIVVTNASTGTVTGLTVSDTLPAQISYLSEQHPIGLAFTNSSPLVSWAGAVILGPGRVLTITVTGRASACYTGPVSNTAWALATSLCGPAEGISATAFDLAPPLPVFTITKTVSPAVPKNGDVVRYRIVVTNTSLATVTDVHISDTLPPAIALMSEAHPAALSYLLNGTVLSWDASAVNLLGPGKSFTVSVTGLAGWCHLGLVSNTAWVFGGNACGTDEKIVRNDYFLTTPLIETLSVAKTFSPAVPANGGPITYRIVVANTGTGTLNNFLVTDTLPGTVTYGGESHPAGMVFVNAPPILAWSGAVPLGPGRAYTFTVTGTSSGCFTGTVSNTAWAAATGLCAPSEGTSTTAYGLVAPTQNIPATAFLQQRISKGQWFTVTMTATNTGTTNVDGFTPYINPFRGGPLVDLRAGPVPAGPLLLVPGAAATFTWTYSASGNGLVAFSVTGVGYTCGATPVLAVSPPISATIEQPAALSARWVAFPARVSIGQNFLLTMTVTNTGSAAATGVDTFAIRQTEGGGASLSAGPNPVLPITIAGGTSRTFTWTMTGATTGNLVFSTTVAGFDANSGLVVNTPPISSNTVIVEKPAALSATLFSYAPAVVCTGRTFLVTMTVTNTGEATANAVNAGTLRLSGLGSVVLTAGPIPALPVVLAGGASKTFTWTFTGSLAGGLDISTTVAGTDANAGWPVTTGPIATSSIGVFTPGALVSGLTARRSVSVGQAFMVALTVTNTGGSPVTGVTPSFSVPSGAGLLNGPTGPIPTGPLTIPGLSSETFLYSFTATGNGVVSFGGGAAGTACYTTGLNTTAAGISSTIILAANIQARLSVSAATVCTGSSLELRLSVTNSGGAAADFVRAMPILVTGSGSAVLVSGPSSLQIPGGSSVNLVWLYTPANPGAIEFSTTVLGLDINSGATLLVGPLTSNSATVLATGGLDISVIAPVSVYIGSPDRGITRPDIFRVTLSVTNTGTAPVVGLVPVAQVTAGATLVNGPLGPLPGSLLSLAAGTSTAFSWTFTATAVGSADIMTRLTYGVCGGPLTSTLASTVQLLNPISLAAQMKVAESRAGLDELVTVIFEITSNGIWTAENATFSGFKYSGTGKVELVSAPSTTNGATLAPGAKAEYRWVFRTLRGGKMDFSASAVCSNGAPPISATGRLEIVEAGKNLNDMWIYPNPFDWTRAINGTLKFRRMPPFSTVQIFTVAGEPVADLKADFNGMAEWNGRNMDGTRVSPAVYLWMAKSPIGKIRRGKVQVAK